MPNLYPRGILPEAAVRESMASSRRRRRLHFGAAKVVHPHACLPIVDLLIDVLVLRAIAGPSLIQPARRWMLGRTPEEPSTCRARFAFRLWHGEK